MITTFIPGNYQPSPSNWVAINVVDSFTPSNQVLHVNGDGVIVGDIKAITATIAERAWIAAPAHKDKLLSQLAVKGTAAVTEHLLVGDVQTTTPQALTSTHPALLVNGPAGINFKLDFEIPPDVKLLVRNGAIVQTDDDDHDGNPNTPKVTYPNVDAKFITIGTSSGINLPGNPFKPNSMYGLLVQWDSDYAGFQLLDTHADKQDRKDAVLFWGNDSKDIFRIRFMGHVPDDLDCKGKKDRRADETNTQPKNKSRERKYDPGFDSEKYYRDIVIIEPDGSFKVNGRVYSYGTKKWSDVRLKESIEPINHALDKIHAMRGVSYLWKDEELTDITAHGKRHLGLLAQEVERVCPEVVSDDKLDGKPTKTIDYTQIVPVLVEAIKEQQDRIDALEKLVHRKKRTSQPPHRRKRLT